MSTLKVNTIQNTSGTSSASTESITNSCKAWVNFNGTGAVAIRAGYNVSSITDNGTGDYTVNFISPIKDSNYCILTTGIVITDQGSSFALAPVVPSGPSTGPVLLKTTTQVRVKSRRETDYDISECNVSIIR